MTGRGTGSRHASTGAGKAGTGASDKARATDEQREEHGDGCFKLTILWAVVRMTLVAPCGRLGRCPFANGGSHSGDLCW